MCHLFQFFIQDSLDLRENMISKKDTEFFRKTVENKIIEGNLKINLFL